MRSRTVFSSRWSKVKQATEVPDWQITAEKKTNCGQQHPPPHFSCNCRVERDNQQPKILIGIYLSQVRLLSSPPLGEVAQQVERQNKMSLDSLLQSRRSAVQDAALSRLRSWVQIPSGLPTCLGRLLGGQRTTPGILIQRAIQQFTLTDIYFRKIIIFK